MEIHNSKFAVYLSPYCFWGWDLPRQNLEFLENLDPSFFLHMAEVHAAAVNEEEGRQHAALALRLFYSHALETMLSLLAAAAQAPDCVVGWICQYREPNLQSILEALSSGKPLLTKLILNEPTWNGLSEAIHSFVSLEDKDKESAVKRGYADFWRHSAQSYLNEGNRFEYNSIKHGLRARSGGYTLRKRREKAPGVPDPDAPVRTLASSQFGSSFYVPEKIGGSKLHLGLRRQAVNWHPQALLDSLVIASMSISNVVSFLRAVNGVDPASLEFEWPEDLGLFRSAWREAPGHQTFSSRTVVLPEHITTFSGEEILKVYENEEQESGEDA
jgi:hypothetical protein